MGISNNLLTEQVEAKILNYLKNKTNTESIEIEKESFENYLNPLCKGEHRNKKCICGSGEKLKKCHGKKRLISKVELDDILELIKIYYNNQKSVYGRGE